MSEPVLLVEKKEGELRADRAVAPDPLAERRARVQQRAGPQSSG